MTEKENKIEKYLRKHDLKWDDLKPSEKKTVAYSVGYINRTLNKMDEGLSKITSRLDALGERLPSAVHKIDSVKDFVQENKLAIVDFTSESCIPCYLLDQPLERTAKRDEEVAIGKIDTDDHMDTVEEYNASEIPLLISFRNGEVVQRAHGAPEDKEHRFERVKWMAQRLKVPTDEYKKTFEMAKSIAKAKGWELNPNESRVTGLISALTYNRLNEGANFCPCKPEHVKRNICPCKRVGDKYLGAEKMVKKQGKCYCGLFWDPDLVKKMEKPNFF